MGFPANLALLALVLPLAGGAFAQSAGLARSERVEMPSRVDSNSPAFWHDGELTVLNSWGFPALSRGPDQFQQQLADPIELDDQEHLPLWIEAVWKDPDGVLYGWYHHEPQNLCPGTTLTAPRIGAVVSFDGGRTFRDLGIVLESGDPVDCSAKNGFFAGGHGDFSVIPGRYRKHLYFLFTNYGGSRESQGVVVARMAIADRNSPAGAVWKYYAGNWTEPGLGGRTTPIFPAQVNWQRPDADSLWGPSVHWNTYLRSYVMLLNRSCCSPGWPQEGIYISYNRDLGNPSGWTRPTALLRPKGWYPQILGTRPGDSDTRAGQTARLYVNGVSEWTIWFNRTPLPPEEDPVPEPGFHW